MNELLARSTRGDKKLTLLQHTQDVMDCGEELFGRWAGPTRLGRAWLRFFQVAPERWPAFHDNLLASAAFHDWGKANDALQAVLHHTAGEQVIRHEHLSALLLALEGVTPWLEARGDVDWDVVLAAVLTHHLQANGRDTGPETPPLGRTTQCRLLHDHADFQALIQVITERLRLAAVPPVFPTSPVWGFGDSPSLVSISERRQKLQEKRLQRFQVELRQPASADRQHMLWAVRAALMAADAAAAGVPRSGMDMTTWLARHVTAAQPCDQALVEREIIARRIQELERKSTKKFSWTDFQQRSATLGDRALLLAPYGSGRILAAWRWVAARLGQNPAAHVIFLYPTRAAAREGFRDYVAVAPEATPALMFSTAELDLEGMVESDNDPRPGSLVEADRRLFALRCWTRRIFAATIDQFLGFLHYSYGAVGLLPVLADAIVVFDEVHSFDHSLFATLKSFLTTFTVPTLCMAATLPEERREALAACGLAICDEKPAELKTIADHPRYRLRGVTQSEVIERIHQALAEGKRVLWVVNQVERAQRFARQLACDFDPANPQQEVLHVLPDVPLFCYHSRFRLADRIQRQGAVVAAFRTDCPTALAITTQVCELGLDMDVDVLVTEDCPITALIQRMSRCNRERVPRENAGEALIYQPLDEAGRPILRPYDPEALLGLEEFVQELGAHDWVTQSDVELALSHAPDGPTRGDKASSFLESGPYALVSEEEVGDLDELYVSAVLQADVVAFLELRQTRQPIDGLLVAVPRRLARGQDGRLPSYVFVVATEQYHAAIGFVEEALQGGSVSG